MSTEQGSRQVLTLALVSEPERVLLAMKKRGFGEGRYNGFGGKLNAGETIEEAAAREMEEEGGIRPRSLKKVGVLEFNFATIALELEVHIFKVIGYEGVLAETEEMCPQWFLWDEVPYDQMWPDDQFWVPLFRVGSLFRGQFLFDAPASKEHEAIILKHSITTVEAL